MSSLFESGRIVDLILLLMLAEALVLIALAQVWRARLPLAGLLSNLAAGAFLILALRAVLTESGWLVAGVWLTMALFAHVVDLAQRFRRQAQKPPVGAP